jgi:hypothetical protein
VLPEDQPYVCCQSVTRVSVQLESPRVFSQVSDKAYYIDIQICYQIYMSVACYSRTLSRGSVIVSLSFSQVSDRAYYPDMLAHCFPCTSLRFVLFEPSLIQGFAKADVTVIIAHKYRPTIPIQGIAIQCKLIDACPRKSAHDKRT